MSASEFDEQTIHALADEFGRLQRVAKAAGALLRRLEAVSHESGEVLRLVTKEEALLRAALKDLNDI